MKTPIFSIRVPADLRTQLDTLAREQGVSVAHVVVMLLRKALVTPQ
jgi:hypothetical protein